ncbi:hypothetical protein ACN47E_003260 [Coniothyrium glycines]
MATEAPDPRTFQSWEDAFQHPVPVVRKLEQQLRTNADDNRERLRSLVGASYRDLLDTAETIIDMEVRMQQVESRLSRVGRSCNSSGIERISSNLVKMDTHNKSSDAERFAFASQLAILRNAPLVMMRLMKKEGSYLLIAKVLVISRLVHKALGTSKIAPPIVDQLWEKLLSVRRKLLRRIDKRLSHTTGEVSTLVESMCAYALATSSTPTDVLNHFHKTRLERMNSELKQGGDELAKHGIGALKACIQTCLDTQTIFPRRLAEALSKLKAQPLIRDPEVRALFELKLDVHDRWIGEEARNYTPWPRHDELQRPEAERILSRWSKDAVSAFLKGIKKALEDEGRLKEVANLRQELIETWILSGSRMAGVKSADVLDDLRDTMNDKLESIIRFRTNSLQNVVSELTKQLNNLSVAKGISRPSLWSTSERASNLSNGAQTFKAITVNTYQGRDESVISVTSTFDEWKKSVLEVKGIIKSMKEARWDDTFVDDVEVESDDELDDTKQTLLSDDDPKLLEEVTQEAISEAMQKLGHSFKKLVARPATDDTNDAVKQAAFLLRIVKEFGDEIPQLRLQDKSAPPTSPFTPDILNPLFSVLSSYVAQPTIRAYSSSLAVALRTKTNSHILAEGNPPLPTQPSPGTFRFLRELNKTMANLGSDIWAPAFVAVLKDKVFNVTKKVYLEQIKAISASGEKTVEESGNKETAEEDANDTANADSQENKAAEASASSEEQKDFRFKQLLFDALYVQRFVAGGRDDNELALALSKKAELDDAAVDRVKKYAADYAKKTYLLFALLA